MVVHRAVTVQPALPTSLEEQHLFPNLLADEAVSHGAAHVQDQVRRHEHIADLVPMLDGAAKRSLMPSDNESMTATESVRFMIC